MELWEVLAVLVTGGVIGLIGVVIGGAIASPDKKKEEAK